MIEPAAHPEVSGSRRFVVRLAAGAVAFVAIAYGTYAAMPRLVGAGPHYNMSRDAAALPMPAGQRFPDGRLDPPRFGQFGFGPGVQEDTPLVKQFDTDGDGRLNAAERRAAREFLATRGGGRRPGFGRARVATDSGPQLTTADVKSFPPNVPLYDPPTLRTIFLTFDERDWEDELTAFYHTDVLVPATLVMDGKTYKEVGVKFRGNSSFRMVPEGRKHSLNISLDFVHDQTFSGYQTLHLLNAHEDASFLHSVLYSEAARSYIPAPKANFMRVVINGESWGVYTNQQPFNKDFLRDGYGTTKGARWKVPGSPRGRGGLGYIGDSVSAYKRLYEIDSKDDPKAWADLIHLCKVLTETPLESLESALTPILDIDNVLRFLALDNALINNDGYWIRASDYSIYEDTDGRFHLVPHDFNETFNDIESRGFGGGFGAGARPGSAELDPLVGMDDETKPLRSRLLAVPALRTRYLGYVRDIADNWLDWKKLGPIAKRHQALIAADVKTDAHRLYDFESFDADGELKAFAERRRVYLLAHTPAK